MTATEVLREEVREYVSKAGNKTLRMVKAVLEIMQESEADIKTNNKVKSSKQEFIPAKEMFKKIE